MHPEQTTTTFISYDWVKQKNIIHPTQCESIWKDFPHNIFFLHKHLFISFKLFPSGNPGWQLVRAAVSSLGLLIFLAPAILLSIFFLSCLPSFCVSLHFLILLFQCASVYENTLAGVPHHLLLYWMQFYFSALLRSTLFWFGSAISLLY